MPGFGIRWVGSEVERLGSSVGSADRLVRRHALKGLQPPPEVIGGPEIGEVSPELIAIVVVVTLYGGVLDRAVHGFDLNVIHGSLGLIGRCSTSS